MDRFIDKNNINHIDIGYEELCLYPDVIMKRICEFLDITYDDGMVNPVNSDSHIGLGNGMQTNPQKNSNIRYDYRWLLDGGVNTVYTSMPWVSRYNMRKVYSNLRTLGLYQNH